MRFLKDTLFLTIPSIILCIVAGEIFFRLIIPASKRPWGYYDPVDKIARFEVGQGIGLYTIGKFAQQRGRWRINNAGWNSDVDYFPRDQRTKPLIAIIGDSFIQAFEVDTENSITARLKEKLHDQYDVYGFGKSGAALSQYLQMTRYVIKRFGPDVIVINVIHNDFDESLRHIWPQPVFLQLDVNGTEVRESTLLSTPITAKRTTKLVFRSAIFRYLWSNLRLGDFWLESKPRQDATNQVPAPEKGLLHHVHASELSYQKDEIYKAADYVVRTMKQESAGRVLIFMVDAPRQEIYSRT